MRVQIVIFSEYFCNRTGGNYGAAKKKKKFQSSCAVAAPAVADPAVAAPAVAAPALAAPALAAPALAAPAVGSTSRRGSTLRAAPGPADEDDIVADSASDENDDDIDLNDIDDPPRTPLVEAAEQEPSDVRLDRANSLVFDSNGVGHVPQNASNNNAGEIDNNNAAQPAPNEPASNSGSQERPSNSASASASQGSSSTNGSEEAVPSTSRGSSSLLTMPASRRGGKGGNGGPKSIRPRNTSPGRAAYSPHFEETVVELLSRRDRTEKRRRTPNELWMFSIAADLDRLPEHKQNLFKLRSRQLLYELSQVGEPDLSAITSQPPMPMQPMQQPMQQQAQYSPMDFNNGYGWN